jgi:Protein of unknown function (DUF3253)
MSVDEDQGTAAAIKQGILTLLGSRAVDSSICPSEVARAVAPALGRAWRALMPQVRSVAIQMAMARRVAITRNRLPLNPKDLGSGPIRLHRGELFDA